MYKKLHYFLVIPVFFFLIVSTITNPVVAKDERTVYLSATEYDYPPFSVTDSGEADGFSVELLKAVAEEMGIVVTFKIDQWTTLKEELANGELDILPLVGYTVERELVYDFTVPYIVMRGNIFVRSGDETITSQDDLYGKEILVLDGDNSQEWAWSIGLDTELTATVTYLEAFELLSSGQYDAVLAQGLVGEKILSDNNITNVEPVYIYENGGATKLKLNLEGYEQKFCFAVTEGDSELLSILNEGLVIVSANGTYDELFAKWFPFLVETQKLSMFETLQYISLFLLPILTILIFGYVITVRRSIRLKTAQIEKNNAANKIIVDALKVKFSSPEERFEYVIKELIELSESMMGFIFSKSDSGEIILKSCYTTIEDHEKDNIALYEVIKTKEIFFNKVKPNSHLLSNDYSSEYPNDELVLCDRKIERLLMLSIPSSEQVNIAVLLNRKTPFSEDNVNQTSILYRGLWSMIEKEEEKEKVEYMSFHDQLTGLYNRRFFEEQMIILDNPRNYPITIVMADVNNLKTVNDTFGHKVGDLLLQNVGELLSKHKRSNDIVTRWGGDEFVILMPKTSLENSKNLIERIQKDTFQMDNEYGKTSIAFGLATKETKDQQLASIFGEAEEHMYHNKQKRQIEQ